MIFNFLRQYLQDDEFEEAKIELAETKQALKEQKEFVVQIQNKSTNDDQEKVDPDFLTLMWTSIGVAIAIFVSTGQKAVELKAHSDELSLYIWIALALFSLYFIVANSINVIALTRKYIKSKKDPAYKSYEWYLTIGAILLALSVLTLAFLK